MSNYFQIIDPVCRAAVLSFEPLKMFTNLLFAFAIGALLLKVVGTMLRHLLLLESITTISTVPKIAGHLCEKYHFPQQKLKIINSNALLAFVSCTPCIGSQIFLSNGVFRKLSSKQIEAVFLHELHHWQKQDALWHPVFAILKETFFFIPSLGDWINHHLQQSELAADTFAIQTLSSSLPLRQALRKWLHQPQTISAPLWATNFASTTSFAQLNARIDAITALSAPTTTSKTPLFSFSLRPALQLSWRLFISLTAISSIFLLWQANLHPIQATVIIPTSSQCQQPWPQASFSRETTQSTQPAELQSSEIMSLE